MISWFKQLFNSTHQQESYYCDGCGEEYPQSHLVYQLMFDGHFCDRCYTYEEE